MPTPELAHTVLFIFSRSHDKVYNVWVFFLVLFSNVTFNRLLLAFIIFIFQVSVSTLGGIDLMILNHAYIAELADWHGTKDNLTQHDKYEKTPSMNSNNLKKGDSVVNHVLWLLAFMKHIH